MDKIKVNLFEFLSELDYQILKFVSSYDSISENEIVSHFSQPELVKFRLSILTKQENAGKNFSSIPRLRPNSSPLEYIYDRPANEPKTNCLPKYRTDKIKITELGLLALQEYEQHQRHLKRKEQIDIAWKISSVILSLLAVLVSFLGQCQCQ